VSRILEWPLLRWIGRLSYSLYIWQQLVIFPAVVPHSPISAIQQVPLNLALLFAIASASYYFIEKPAIRLGRRLETPSRLTFGFTSVPVAAK
jgi:peptidoglycan/LPS O-acetylase OafA/YrhL